MRSADELIGGEVIRPGERDWFPADDWNGGCYLFDYGDEVWLSLLLAKNPGTGALTRLMAAIWGRGAIVVVPCPFAHMRAILEHKGFRSVDGHPCEVFAKEAT